jgi:2,4-dienoyl-CoA reductase-like NADH-dependent reductase (Old Yellow Enzyme family)
MKLLDPFRIREVQLRNRIVVSPMCQYSAKDGHPQTWHLVHLGSRAVGGAGLVMAEATAVEARGRISPSDTGIYEDSHIESWRPIVVFIRSQGALPGIQLAHAGRKASVTPPWDGGKAIAPQNGGWVPVAPSAIAFGDAFAVPDALGTKAIGDIAKAFRQAAARALSAGFEVLELHSAHGYLLHEFLSPLCNTRADEYGGAFENRICLTLQVVQAVRKVWPQRLPLFVRLSATDWKEGGWDLEQAIELSRKLKSFEVDLIDVSSGGAVPGVKIPLGPGYQVKFAESIRKQAGIATGAVGLITEPAQAETILMGEQADLIFLAREMLRDPYWPRRAANILGEKIKPPVQYERAW